MKKLLIAGIAMAALAGPAFAQALPTLTTSPTSQSTAVTTSVANACTLSTPALAPFVVINTNVNGTFQAPAAQNITVTCNTPNGNVSLGSDDMVNAALIDTSETSTFTNKVKFMATAASDNWQLDSRAVSSFADAATVGYDSPNRRQRILAVSVGSFDLGGKLPVAGSYTGTVCLTVDPSGSLTGSTFTNDDRFCTNSIILEDN